MKTLLTLLLAAGALPAASRADRYAVILNDPPLAQQVEPGKLATQAAADRKARIVAAQSTVGSVAALAGVKITSASQVLVNALFVQANETQAEQLRRTPGVRLVEKLRPVRMNLNRALDITGVIQAWSSVNGESNAGAGVKIAIIDTGIDQTHPGFQNESVSYPTDFPKCSQERGDCAYVNKKVIVARSYVDLLVGGDEPQTSRPDDVSPRDRVGHGTALAMAAAGVRNTGPLGTISGVAPGAWLGNYKVFGSPGVNSDYTTEAAWVRALEDALKDGMDIAILSLGLPAIWGPLDQGATCGLQGSASCDWRAAVIDNAAKNNMTIVVAAGNDGDTATRYPAFNSIHSPGTAPSAITVGATTNSHILFQTVQIPGGDKLPTYFSDGPRPSTAITAPLRDVSRIQNNGQACSPFGEGVLNGAIALIERGGCGLIGKIQNVQSAGAVAAILYETLNINGVSPMTGMEETGIPSILVGNRNGLALKDYASRVPNGNVTLDPALSEVSSNVVYDTVAYFSSRGPSIGETAIKPELVAVGTDLYTATQKYDPNGRMFDASGYAMGRGTSFAAALVGGAAALVKQRNPKWSPAQIKSALVNTAIAQIEDEDESGGIVQASVLDIGAGKLQAQNAVRTNLTITPATLSFGAVNTLPLSRNLEIRNTSNQAITLTIQDRPNYQQRARLVISGSMNIPAGGVTTIMARLEGARPSAGTYEGVLRITGGAVELNVPYLYMVGDGVPFSVLPLRQSGFEGEILQSIELLFKVVDQFGLPVQNAPTLTSVTFGSGLVARESGVTDSLGIGYADVVLGRLPGDQEFYVAVGNRANFGIYFDGRARFFPVIDTTGVTNAASLVAGDGFAPGSYITIKGRALSEVLRVYDTTFLPLALANVSVSFDVPSQNLSVPARLHFVSGGQINVQIPWELRSASSAMLKVSVGDTSSDVVTIPLREQSPGVFEYTDSSGRLLAAARDLNYAIIGPSNPAKRDDYIQIYANGLGPVENQPASGEPSPAEPLARTRVLPEVTIAGQRAEVSFAGLTPGAIGLYQINVRLPASVATGMQPLVVSVNGMASKSVTIPIQ